MKKNFYLAILLIIPSIMMAQKTFVLPKRNTAASPANYWSLKGNSNINDTANFLGTTDAHPLIFKVNGSLSGRLDFDGAASNTSFGYQALGLPAHGFSNTAVGYAALASDSSGGNNVAIGVTAMALNTVGDGNIAVGNYALHDNDSGTANIAIGSSALFANRNGIYNVAIGTSALVFNLNGAANVAIGYNALDVNTATANTATGYSAMFNNTTGQLNTAYGYSSLYYNVNGGNNTATGSYSLQNNATGNYNTAFGYQALNTNLSGNRNTALGANADVTDANFRNSTAIGYNAKVDASYKVQVGNMSVKSIGGAVGWTNYSDERIKDNIKENVPGLAFIKQLKPVTYHFNTAKENALLGRKDSLNELSESKIDKIQFTGFLAQDVEAAAKKINYDFSGVDKTGKIMGLRYSEFVVPLVKAVQELSAKNDSLQAVNENLQKDMETLQSRLDKIEAKLNGSPSATDFSASSSLPALSAANGLSLYPNPAKNNLTLLFNTNSQASATILILDMKGNGVIQKSFSTASGSNTMNLNISALAKGTYTLQVQTAGTTFTKKFVKE